MDYVTLKLPSLTGKYFIKYIPKECDIFNILFIFSETNLKCRQCLIETAELGQDDALIGAFDGEIVCEVPNNLLNKFDGK